MTIFSPLSFSTDLVLDALKDKNRSAKDVLAALGLKDQQILEAKVLKVISQNQAQLLIDGKKLTATTRMPLAENETLTLQVTRNAGQPVLRRMETVQSLPPLREGLTEMRKLGREGPYAVLSDILNAKLPEAPLAADTTQPFQPVKSTAAGAPSEPGPLPETPDRVPYVSDPQNSPARSVAVAGPGKVWVGTPTPPAPDPKGLLETTAKPPVAHALTEADPEQPTILTGKAPLPASTAMDKPALAPRLFSPTPPLDVPIKNTGAMPVPDGAGQNPADKTLTTALTPAQQPLPPALSPDVMKLTALILEKPSGLPQGMEPLLEAVEKDLVSHFFSASPDTPASETVIEREAQTLSKAALQVLDDVPPAERQELRRFLDNNQLTWKDKLIGVLESGSGLLPSKSLNILREVLTAPATADAVANHPPTSGPPAEAQAATVDPPAMEGDGVPETIPGSQDASLLLKKNTPSLIGGDTPRPAPAKAPEPAMGLDVEQPEIPLTGSDRQNISVPAPKEARELSGTGTPAPPGISTVPDVQPEKTLPARNAAEPSSTGPEQNPVQNVKRDLEHIFTRLESALEKQSSVFEHESDQTLGLVKKIRSLVASFTLGPEEPFEETTVRHLVRDSGLMWENKLKTLAETMPEKITEFTRSQTEKLVENDVKALALKGTELPADEGPEEARGSVRETLRTFSESLEKMQTLNSQAADDTGKYLLPLPYVHGGQIRFGQLLIDLDKKKNTETDGRERIIRVAFLLDMSRLGPVQAGVSLYKKSISGEFQVGSPEIKQLMDEALPELADTLSAKGFSVTRLECRVADAGRLSEASLVEKITQPSDRALSIRI